MSEHIKVGATDANIELSPYEKIECHFAKELGEAHEADRIRAEIVRARDLDRKNQESGLKIYERIENHFAAELGEKDA